MDESRESFAKGLDDWTFYGLADGPNLSWLLSETLEEAKEVLRLTRLVHWSGPGTPQEVDYLLETEESERRAADDTEWGAHSPWDSMPCVPGPRVGPPADSIS